MTGVSFRVVCELASDLYHQGKKPDDAPFGLNYFRQLVSGMYNTLLNEDFRFQKSLKKAEEGYSWVELSPDWYIRKRVTVQKDDDTNEYYAELPAVQMYEYDVMSTGIQQVSGAGKNGSCLILKRTTLKDAGKHRLLPVHNIVYYHLENNKRLVLTGLKGNATGVELDVFMVPAIDGKDDNALISESKKMPIVTAVLNLMFSAKNGEVQDMVNNSNSNVVPDTEIDRNSLRQ